MKHIFYRQFVAMKSALLEHITRQSDPYECLCVLVNGYPTGYKRLPGEPKRLFTKERLKDLWDNPDNRDTLAELAILKHYKGHKVSTTAITTETVYQDTINLRVKQLLTQNNEQI